MLSAPEEPKDDISRIPRAVLVRLIERCKASGVSAEDRLNFRLSDRYQGLVKGDIEPTRGIAVD